MGLAAVDLEPVPPPQIIEKEVFHWVGTSTAVNSPSVARQSDRLHIIATNIRGYCVPPNCGRAADQIP
jgi:hypothetical protein